MALFEDRSGRKRVCFEGITELAPGDKKESKPARLDAARERFEVAMVRLENALEANANNAGGIDVEEMTAQTSALRKENEELSKKNRAVGERLDGAISRLKTVLEGA